MREENLKIFLEKYGWDKAKRTVLAADASFRTYDRLSNGKTSVVLMNSPLSEHPDKFVYFNHLLRQAGIHAPEILAADLENGFLLLEDFGDNTFSKLLAAGKNAYDLYRIGVENLIRMQQNIILPQEGITYYSPEKLMNEALLLPNWFGKYVVPGGLPEEAKEEFIQLWFPLINRIDALPKTLVLLDYHADNLMITPTGDCGVLDFQDARIGPATYDLMSLLEDERRDVPADIREKLLTLYFDARPELDTQEVHETLPIVAMQRHTKVIGIFVRLFLRDKKEKYLDMIPLVWELTERHLDNPIFADYKAWIERYIPVAVRHQHIQAEDLT